MRAIFLGAFAIALLAVAPASASGPSITYVPNSLLESQLFLGPWMLHGYSSPGPRQTPHDANGIVPPPSQTMPPYVGTGVPYQDICGPYGSGRKNKKLAPMQPYYFPFVRKHGTELQGFFDYRPRNQQEAVVSAFSYDLGITWTATGEALELNPYCPWDWTDPDNLAVKVNGLKVPYGADPSNAADNGLGHPVVLTISGVQRLYQLNRANGHIDSDQLVVHTLPPPSTPADGSVGLSRLPQFGYVSSLSSGGYPTLTSALQTTGMQSPDAIMGSVPMGSTTAVIYVEKQLNADNLPPYNYPVCNSTPAFALTNLVNNKPRKANHDVTTVRIATTTDGLTFTDVGPATGLFDPTTTAFNNSRWLGSGSIVPLSDGRYGMFFGAGNCLDNDSDAFHYLGYAETVNVVNSASDLLQWTVINGFDNPILSTDTVTDPSGPRAYPLNAPIVNVTGADALTPAQVAPFTPATAAPPLVTPPGGYNSNFFSGRVYDPQAIYTDATTLTIIFAGYNTPQPSNNLGDYRTIGRFQLNVPKSYFKPF